MKQPLVSVIVTTRNNHATLEACLESIKQQSYGNIELIVVDRDSDDDTKDIARRYTDKVFNKGPERSAQRNYAVSKATGDYVVIIDSDMELSKDVIHACVKKVQSDVEIEAVIIPEESFGQGFWAQCKKLERSFYIGIDWIEAARFFDKKIYQQVGGYDEELISGEDWDLSQRVGAVVKIGRINEYIRHNEGHIKLFQTLKKKSYYAKKFTNYTIKTVPGSTTESISLAAAATGLPQSVNPQRARNTRNPYIIVLKRFGLFFSHPVKLFRNPILGIGVLFMKVCEFGFGALGYLGAKDQDKHTTK